MERGNRQPLQGKGGLPAAEVIPQGRMGSRFEGPARSRRRSGEVLGRASQGTSLDQEMVEGPQWRVPFAKWFVGGQINVSQNCLDRHLDTPRRNKAAIVWEGEPGDRRVLTYQMVWREVNRFANVLKRLGVKRGDRVTIYLPAIPE